MITNRKTDTLRDLPPEAVENHYQGIAIKISRVVTEYLGEQALTPKVDRIIDDIAQIGTLKDSSGQNTINENITRLLNVLDIDFKHKYYELIKRQIQSILASEK